MTTDGVSKLLAAAGEHENLVSGGSMFPAGEVRTQPPGGRQVSADHR